MSNDTRNYYEMDINKESAAARVASRDRTTRLPAFRVTYGDGESYVTSMAAGVTLAEARAYFVGTRHTMSDEKTTKTVATVEEVTP